jgi:2-amino-4-hydroxy-6-hydroxymethyldihydropteridine diphosphokinase
MANRALPDLQSLISYPRSLVVLGIGSNRGDSQLGNSGRIVLDAIKELESLLFEFRQASLYETNPLYVTDQGQFINTVVAGYYAEKTAANSRITDPLETARKLLFRIQVIEKRFGRDRSRERRWGERTLDVDILLFGNLIMNEPDLIIPHPRLKERRFALEPLLEILPEAAEPGTGLSYALCCQSLPDQGVRRLTHSPN